MSEPIENHAISKLSNVDSNVIIVVDLDVTLSQVKYLYEISNVKGTRAERSDNWSMHVVFRVYPCHLRCLVM